jgi:hypothetical protein
MKSKIGCGIVAASLLAAQGVFASFIGTGSLNIVAPGYPPDQAGPYTVTILGVTSGLRPISTGGSFETFCMGPQVDYYPGSTYNYEISDTVQPSGVVSSPGYDYVTWGVAWLYSQYRAGAIGAGTQNNHLNDALQDAIWTLQGQSLAGVTFYPDSTAYQNFMDAAANAAAVANISSDQNNANGAFGVYALDMVSGGTYAQPQLCMVPVPEPDTILAGALMLLPFGAGALRLVRRRLA